MDLQVTNDYPARYEHARTSLIECAEIDECKDWIDKAAAMEVYAKQANDDTLLKMAMRIKLRAAKKTGELINAIPSGQGNNQHSEGNHPKLTRNEVAQENGISEHQQKTYQRIANIDDDEFESQVESEAVPTMTALAEQGKKEFLGKLNAYKGFPTYWVGALDRLIEQSKKIEPDGLSFHDQEARIKTDVRALIIYLGKLL